MSKSLNLIKTYVLSTLKYVTKDFSLSKQSSTSDQTLRAFAGWEEVNELSAFYVLECMWFLRGDGKDQVVFSIFRKHTIWWQKQAWIQLSQSKVECDHCRTSTEIWEHWREEWNCRKGSCMPLSLRGLSFSRHSNYAGQMNTQKKYPLCKKE